MTRFLCIGGNNKLSSVLNSARIPDSWCLTLVNQYITNWNPSQNPNPGRIQKVLNLSGKRRIIVLSCLSMWGNSKTWKGDYGLLGCSTSDCTIYTKTREILASTLSQVIIQIHTQIYFTIVLAAAPPPVPQDYFFCPLHPANWYTSHCDLLTLHPGLANLHFTLHHPLKTAFFWIKT